jgi:cobalt-zinc-cadmium resistance protein CzcA
MGTEFIPSLDEGDIAMHALRIPGTSLTQSVMMQQVLEQEIKKIPEVLTIFGKIGTAEVATDPMPPSVADTFIMLKPRQEWTNPNKTKADIVKEIEAVALKVPGNNYEFTQPIQMRFNELISGVRSDVAVKIFGDDIDQLLKSASEVEKQIKKTIGASDVKIEQATGLPIMSIIPNREHMDYYGLNMNDIQTIIQIAMGGYVSGQLFQGDRRFDIVVRLPEYLRNNTQALENLPIPITKSISADTNYIPLSQVAHIEIAYGANQISRENGKRRVVITANVRDRDLGSFVTEIKNAIDTKVTIPVGYWVSYGGTFEQLIAAKDRLMVVIPVVLALIFG